MSFEIIAGPCAIESQEQIEEIANFLRSCGMNWVKGGGWKPLTWGPGHRKEYQKSLGVSGIDLLVQEAIKYNLCSLSEVPYDWDEWHPPSRIQVGARNQQNFLLLESLNYRRHPILLKRHFGCSLEELYASTTYLPDCNVWVCERGVVSPHMHGFRYLLDYQAVVEWKRLRVEPIFVDVSHWVGSLWSKDHYHSSEIYPVIVKAAKASKVLGADGILVDVHPRPEEAWVDPYQALNFNEFRRLLEELEKIPC